MDRLDQVVVVVVGAVVVHGRGAAAAAAALPASITAARRRQRPRPGPDGVQSRRLVVDADVVAVDDRADVARQTPGATQIGEVRQTAVVAAMRRFYFAVCRHVVMRASD